MIRRPPRSTPLYSSAASDVYKRQVLQLCPEGSCINCSAQARSQPREMCRPVEPVVVVPVAVASSVGAPDAIASNEGHKTDWVWMQTGLSGLLWLSQTRSHPTWGLQMRSHPTRGHKAHWVWMQIGLSHLLLLSQTLSYPSMGSQVMPVYTPACPRCRQLSLIHI